MTPPPGPYSGASTLALVARASAFSFGLVYGSVKLKILKILLHVSCECFDSNSILVDTWMQPFVVTFYRFR
ncbi:ATP synthase chain [Salix suchowensis]|nr:ATP synthase chain [Salix suchowensis]